ncbi:MAG: metallopeptidase family protein, partial [Chloroflexi bacterium]|nr:metallopeptidase family protein [Chloroflexota bacterium]
VGMLLGLYEGTPLTRRAHYHLAAPDRITLFRGPLLLEAQRKGDLVGLIRRTIIHEVAHHFGFSEEQLRQLGC